jgi:hypothetical protein
MSRSGQRQQWWDHLTQHAARRSAGGSDRPPVEPGARFATGRAFETGMTKPLAAIGAALLIALMSCGHALPRPPWTRHATSAFAEVPFPPPPGRVEFIPPQPRPEAVWIDGEWTWEPIGQRWAWKYGRWVVSPSGARYARWAVVRASDGTLFFAPGVWLDAKGREVEPPPVLALARASDEDVVNPEGTKEPTGTNVLPEPLQSHGAGAPPASSSGAGCELDAGPPPPPR